MNDPSDLDRLVEAARSGDRAAQDALLERVRPRLKKLVRRQRSARAARAAHASSDIVQSVLVRLHLDFDRFREGGIEGFQKWVATYARRHVRNVERRYACGKRGGGVAHEAVAEEFARDDATPDRVIAAREAADLLREAIAGLDDAQRQAVELARLEGLSHAEIVEVLGGTIAANRTRLKRALRRLMAEMPRELVTEFT